MHRIIKSAGGFMSSGYHQNNCHRNAVKPIDTSIDNFVAHKLLGNQYPNIYFSISEYSRVKFSTKILINAPLAEQTFFLKRMPKLNILIYSLYRTFIKDN
jgi:hypothetical protein